MLDFSLINIICTVANLLILFAIFKIFLFNRVDKILQARREEVEDATKAADIATKNAIKTQKEYEERIALADEEKEQILSDIKKQGYDEYERIVNDAKIRGEKIIVEAKHNAEVENERAKEVYAAQLADMVIDAASKIAASKHNYEEDKELYDKFISEAGANNE